MLERAEKLIFISIATIFYAKELVRPEEKEIELLCRPVEEESYGTALVGAFAN